MDLKKAVAHLEDKWAHAQVQKGGGSELPPDGLYHCRVDEFDFVEGDFGVLWISRLTVVAPEAHSGWQFDVLQNLLREESIPFIKKQVVALGLDGDRPLGDLQVQLPEALDRIVEVNVKTKGEYRNAYINQVVVSNTSDLPPTPTVANTYSGGRTLGDDVPF